MDLSGQSNVPATELTNIYVFLHCIAVTLTATTFFFLDLYLQ